MGERLLISVFEEKKYLVLIPEGLSKPEMEVISTLGIITKIYKENELFKQYEGVTDRYNEELFDFFPGYEKLLFIKNPYWRTLEFYLWKYIYSDEYDGKKTEIFKKTIKKLYDDDNNFSQRELKNKKSIQAQNLNLTENYFICENLKEESLKWFNVNINVIPNPFSRIPNSSSFYDSSMFTMSDFYDKECAEMIYEKNRDIFEKFGYSFYSYLDFHDPVSKIHSLHGKPINNFEF